uniref:Uncharacterized protein n=1 Tax=Glossina pallidipes TaxID=7398 RepID=A0A1B0ACX9_GLOPL
MLSDKCSKRETSREAARICWAGCTVWAKGFTFLHAAAAAAAAGAAAAAAAAVADSAQAQKMGKLFDKSISTKQISNSPSEREVKNSLCIHSDKIVSVSIVLILMGEQMDWLTNPNPESIHITYKISDNQANLCVISIS